jgi:transketolase
MNYHVKHVKIETINKEGDRNMDSNRLDELQRHARAIRYHLMDSIGALGVGHVGGCLSVADILAVLYFEKMQNLDPQQPHKADRDRLIMSKGHAGPALYATLALKGYFPMEWLMTLNQPETLLPSHCDMNRTPGIDMTAGSLGQGISCAVGMAKGSKIRRDGVTIYAIIGDGEAQEGQVWEAAMAASHFKLDNLIVFMDNNKAQIDGYTIDINNPLDLKAKWAAFGFNTYEIDGHDIELISNTIDTAKALKNNQPTMIILDTIKGKGVSFAEAAGAGSHNMPVNAQQRALALEENQ